MAELGNIKVSDVHRAVDPVREANQGALLESYVGAGKAIVGEVASGSVNREYEDVLSSATTNAQPTPEGGVQDGLAQTLDRLTAQVRQGNSSQQTLATIQIKEILANAQNKWGWTGTDFAGRASRNTMVELEKLGLLDAANEAAAKVAQSQLDDIWDRATKRVEDGGLGMDPALNVNSPEFIAQYTLKAQTRAFQQENELRAQMVLSGREASALEKENVAFSLLQGRASSIRGTLDQTFSDNGLWEAMNQSLRGEQADLDTLTQFQTTGGVAITLQLEAEKTALQQLYANSFTGAEFGTEAAKRVKVGVTDAIAEIDSYVRVINGAVEDLPSGLAHIEALYRTRGYDVYRGATEPYKDFMAFISGPGKTVYELALQNPSADGLDVKLSVGKAAKGILSANFPTLIGPNATPGNTAAMVYETTGQGTLLPSMDYRAVNDQLRILQRNAQSPWYVPTASDAEELEAAYWAADKHSQLWNQVLKTPESADPDTAAIYLTGLNNSLIAFNDIARDKQPTDVALAIRAGLADDRLLEAIDIIGDSGRKAERQAFGETAKIWYENTKPTARRNEILDQYQNKKIQGVPMFELAKVDVTLMDQEGTFAYIVDQKQVDRAAKNLYQFMMDEDRGENPSSYSSIRRTVESEIVTFMEKVSKEVNESITINRNLNAATASSADKRRRSNVKLQYFDELGWLDGFNYTSTQ
jgi:hypothetical protein